MAVGRMFVALGSIVAVLSIITAGTFLVNPRLRTKMAVFWLQLLLLLFVVLFFVSRYVWVNLMVLLPGPRSKNNSVVLLTIHRIAYAFLLAFLGLASCSIPIGQFFVGPEPYFINQVGFTCLGLLILIFFNLCVSSAFVKCLKLCRKDIPNADKWKSIVSVTVAVFLCIQGLTTASRGPAVVHVKIPLPKLPHSMNGTKIVQLSDIHLGPEIGRTALERVVNMALVQQPDIIVITGDLVDSSVLNLKQAVLPLKKLKSRHGTYFITGNHEYFTGDADAWLDELKTLGVHPLHNSHVVISGSGNSNDKIYLAGVDDIEADMISYDNHGMKLSDALDGRSRGYPTILLAHQPRAVHQALDQFEDIDLILSGHTHGGQFFPMNIPIYLFNPFFAGLYRHKSTFVYVSSGTYFYGVPMRIGSISEITVLTLVR